MNKYEKAFYLLGLGNIKDLDIIKELVERATKIEVETVEGVGYFCPKCEVEVYNTSFCTNCGQAFIVGSCE